MAKKAKNTGRCSKISLHKKFKLNLEQNVSEQTCLEIIFGLQKCSVHSENKMFLLSKIAF